MSNSSIARWNAIPLERPAEGPVSTTLKRGRLEYEGNADNNNDDDDDISLVSRSPSPPPPDAMIVDELDIHKYDEYVQRPAREVITVETKIKPTNKGFALLEKLGWKEGQPIGLSGEGRLEPVPFHIKQDLTGLGKTSQDVRMIEETVSQRRELDSERQQKESEEQRKQREDVVARKQALESEISTTLRAFYCTLCDKQFKNVAQYDEHTNSYAHHHKARFRDMQANVRVKPQEEVDKRKEKERKREEKELRKIAAANGIKMPKVAPTPLNPTIPMAPLPTAVPTSENANMVVDETSNQAKKSNWISVSGAQSGLNSNSSQGGNSGFSRVGWATVGTTSSAGGSRFGASTSSSISSSSNLPDTPTNAAVNTNDNLFHNPTFRNAGWTSLETGSSVPFPTSPASSMLNHYETPPPPPSGPSGRGGWSRVTSSTYVTPPQPADTMSPVSLPIQPPAPTSMPVRSNWQQFQKGIGRRK